VNSSRCVVPLVLLAVAAPSAWAQEPPPTEPEPPATDVAPPAPEPKPPQTPDGVELQVSLENVTAGAATSGRFVAHGTVPFLPRGTVLHVTLQVLGRTPPIEAAVLKTECNEAGQLRVEHGFEGRTFAPLSYEARVVLHMDAQPRVVKRQLMKDLGYQAADSLTLATKVHELGTPAERAAFARETVEALLAHADRAAKLLARIDAAKAPADWPAGREAIGADLAAAHGEYRAWSGRSVVLPEQPALVEEVYRGLAQAMRALSAPEPASGDPLEAVRALLARVETDLRSRLPGARGDAAPEPPEPRPADARGAEQPPAFLPQVLKAVVKVYGAGGFQGVPAYGTGVVVDERGFVLTAWSIALRTDALKVVTHDGRRYAAEVWSADPGLGVALLHVTAPDAGLVAVRLGDSSAVQPGDTVWAIGNPFDIIYGDEQPGVAQGIVTAVGSPRASGKDVVRLPERLERVIVTDLPSNPGTQGGPLLTRDGELVGIVGRIVESRATNTIINYAVPAAECAALVQEGVEAGKPRPERPRVTARGPVGPRPVHGLRLQRVHLARPPMAYVEAVLDGSPAAAAGVRPDDLLFRVDGRTIRTVQDWDDLLEGKKAGDALHIVLKRGNDMKQVELRLAPGKE
jgi:S1-C subfamily serine protease